MEVKQEHKKRLATLYPSNMALDGGDCAWANHAVDLYADSWVIGFTGPKGSGKTLAMTYIICYAMACGFRTWANYKIRTSFLGLPGGKEICESEPLDMQALLSLSGDISNGLVAIDELPLYAESRASMSNRNKMIDYALMQVRKRSIHFFYTTQNYAWVDNRVRWTTDILVKCRDLSKFVTDDHYDPDLGHKLEKGEKFQLEMWDMSGQWTGFSYEERRAMGDFEPQLKSELYGKPIWDCYDTSELIDVFEAMRGVEINLAKHKVTDTVASEMGTLIHKAELAARELSRDGGEIPVEEFYTSLGVPRGELGTRVQIGKHLSGQGAKKKQRGPRYFYDFSGIIDKQEPM